MYCDFCNSEQVVAAFDAPDMEMATLDDITHMSEGGWAACDPCAELVLAGDGEGLVNRVVASLPWIQDGRAEAGHMRMILGRLYDRLLPELRLAWRTYEVE